MMDKRSQAGPMDYQWANNTGPVDASSPFMTAFQSQGQNIPGQKRTYSNFESHQRPQAPAWSRAMSQPSVFPPTPSAKPASIPRTPSFSTIREKLDVDSSGPENQTSPEGIDNDDTPERPSRNGVTLTKTDGTMQYFYGNKQVRKPAALGQLAKQLTPGRGEIQRGNYSNAISKRVHKKRRRDASRENRLTRRSQNDDSESDSRSRRGSSEINAPQNQQNQHQQSSQPQEIGFLPSLFAFIEAHPSLPHILSFYAQLLLNVFLIFFFIYIIYSFWSTIRSDVDKRSEEVAAETLAEMAVCARQFVENRCDRQNRVPAMETVCNNWENCMNKDPSSVGRARVSAHTFAEIFNSFVEPISYKAMIFTLSIVFGCVAVSNFAFGFFRTKSQNPHPPSQSPYMQPPTQQPQHHQYPQYQPQPQYGYPGRVDLQWHTPHQNHVDATSPFRRDRGVDFGFQTPVKRLGY